ncbi:MAG: hypothetical protein DWQ36_06835 [Acidobacteria bacterium]|nr:MAG: hypothetical protein DWQ30_24270 [Acidobacteriota bacterium]REK09264.1 MAG: hypothetical protein DWQ36_06835 [Acidobacteriota bacterium]
MSTPSRPTAWITGVRQDVMFALRQFRRSPGLVITALLSLGLGIGFLATIFAMTDAFFLRPLPFYEPERVVHVWGTDGRTGAEQLRVSESNFLDWRAQSDRFDDLAGYYYSAFTLTEDGGSSKLNGTYVSTNLLGLLGVAPARGRSFQPGDAEEGADRVAIVSHRFWRDQLAAREPVVGSEIELDGMRHTVIGAMPPSFVFPFNNMELWLPLAVEADESSRGADGPLLVIGRLADGATPQTVQSELDAITARLAGQYPDTNQQRGAVVVELRSALLFTWDIFRLVFPALFAAVGFVLLLVCANLGNLLLARLTRRREELAFRLTLGASRSRIVRQLVTESLVLGLLGGAFGLGFAALLTGVLEQAIPLDLYRVGAIGLDARGVLFAFVACLLTVLAFGVAPALRVVTPRLAQTLRSGGRGADGETRRLRNALVVAQIALAVMLVAGAALMARTFAEMQDLETGFESANLLTLEIVLPQTSYPDDEQENAFFDQVVANLGAIPGVEAATSGYPLPLNFESLGGEIEIEGWEKAPDEVLQASTYWIGDGYLETLGTPLIAGRMFESGDNADSSPVVLVNQTLAERYWPGEAAIGRRIFIADTWREIVGVAGDSVTMQLGEEIPSVVYYPQSQRSTRRRFIYLRHQPGATPPLSELRQRIARVDPAIPVTNVRSMHQVVATSYGPWLMGLGGIGVLGFGALLLASVGLYGLVSYSVAQRTREFGVRKALGAGRADVVRLVLRESSVLAALGLGIGMVGVFALSRFLASLLFGVSALDPLALGSVAVVLAAAVLLASWLPARRASRISAGAALRWE